MIRIYPDLYLIFLQKFALLLSSIFFLHTLHTMLKVDENISLFPFNTFRVDVRSKYLSSIDSKNQLMELMASPLYKREPYFILGGGSNILFSDHFDGLIIKTNIKGIEKEKETKDHVWIKAYSGEIWSDLVTYAVANDWGGLENLALIPGQVGAAPIQNIGAYGTEIKTVIDSVEAIDLSSGTVRIFNKKECAFGYRESIFKNTLKEQFFILSVTLKLTKHHHAINLSYGNIHEVLEEHYPGKVTIQSISKAVTQIRKNKLPDPAVIGNAGSFFKNPIVSDEHYKSLQQREHDIPGYAIAHQGIKIPAGWLIEQCGWKGKKVGPVGVHHAQALVLVNHDGGSGKDIMALAKDIQESVVEKFQIQLTPEVTII